MLKWIIMGLLVAVILGLYFYTEATKQAIDVIVNMF